MVRAVCVSGTATRRRVGSELAASVRRADLPVAAALRPKHRRAVDPPRREGNLAAARHHSGRLATNEFIPTLRARGTPLLSCHRAWLRWWWPTRRWRACAVPAPSWKHPTPSGDRWTARVPRCRAPLPPSSSSTSARQATIDHAARSVKRVQPVVEPSRNRPYLRRSFPTRERRYPPWPQCLES